MRILIVDDDHACKKVLGRLLNRLGSCTMVDDGAMAVESVRQALASNQPFDLITLDIHMPRMDGHDAAHQIRQMEEQAAIPRENRVKIMMVTALGDAMHLAGAYSNDCDAYIVKPFDREKLFEQLSFLGFIEQQPV